MSMRVRPLIEMLPIPPPALRPRRKSVLHREISGPSQAHLQRGALFRAKTPLVETLAPATAVSLSIEPTSMRLDVLNGTLARVTVPEPPFFAISSRDRSMAPAVAFASPPLRITAIPPTAGTAAGDQLAARPPVSCTANRWIDPSRLSCRKGKKRRPRAHSYNREDGMSLHWIVFRESSGCTSRKRGVCN